MNKKLLVVGMFCLVCMGAIFYTIQPARAQIETHQSVQTEQSDPQQESASQEESEEQKPSKLETFGKGLDIILKKKSFPFRFR